MYVTYAGYTGQHCDSAQAHRGAVAPASPQGVGPPQARAKGLLLPQVTLFLDTLDSAGRPGACSPGRTASVTGAWHVHFLATTCGCWTAQGHALAPWEISGGREHAGHSQCGSSIASRLWKLSHLLFRGFHQTLKETEMPACRGSCSCDMR